MHTIVFNDGKIHGHTKKNEKKDLHTNTNELYYCILD